MDNRMKFINRQRQMAIAFAALGAVVALLGVALPGLIGDTGFNTRIVTGLGIVLMGVGLSAWIRYLAMRRETPEAARMLNEKMDERTQMLQARAGNRAFWVMMAMAYAGLMWVSFASNGSLPPMTDEALWWYLAALVVLPFGVYAASLVIEQR